MWRPPDLCPSCVGLCEGGGGEAEEAGAHGPGNEHPDVTRRVLAERKAGGEGRREELATITGLLRKGPAPASRVTRHWVEWASEAGRTEVVVCPQLCRRLSSPALELLPDGPRRWGACFRADFLAVVLVEVMDKLAFVAVVVPPPLWMPCND